MIRNLSLVSRGVVNSQSASVTSGRKFLSTRQVPIKKECLYDVDAYPAENGFIRNSPYENISIPNRTLDQYVWNNFREYETKIAAVSSNKNATK